QLQAYDRARRRPALQLDPLVAAQDEDAHPRTDGATGCGRLQELHPFRGEPQEPAGLRAELEITGRGPVHRAVRPRADDESLLITRGRGPQRVVGADRTLDEDVEPPGD